MHIISKLLVAIAEWLNAPGVAESQPVALDWSDLPTYHPSRD